MRTKPRFPGQSDRSIFTLEQAEALTSAIRSEVFWAFDAFEPHSAADVASALGKSAQTVHYHVHELVDVGLLIGVETRKRRARTETLYVHGSLNFLGQGPKASAEYRACVRKGFTAITRAMAREEEALQDVYDVPDDSISAFSAYRRESFRLSPEQAAWLKSRLSEVLAEALNLEPSEDGTRVNVAIYMKPTQGESRRWRQRALAAQRKRKT